MRDTITAGHWVPGRFILEAWADFCAVDYQVQRTPPEDYIDDEKLQYEHDAAYFDLFDACGGIAPGGDETVCERAKALADARIAMMRAEPEAFLLPEISIGDSVVDADKFFGYSGDPVPIPPQIRGARLRCEIADDFGRMDARKVSEYLRARFGADARIREHFAQIGLPVNMSKGELICSADAVLKRAGLDGVDRFGGIFDGIFGATPRTPPQKAQKTTPAPSAPPPPVPKFDDERRPRIERLIDNWLWSDGYMPRIREIVGFHSTVPTPLPMDRTHAADLMTVKTYPMLTNVRMRRPRFIGLFWNDFIIRNVAGVDGKTEFQKLLGPQVDWMFYGVAASDDDGDIRIAQWVIIDLNVWRDTMKNCAPADLFTKKNNNDDGGEFLVFEYDDFPPSLIVAASFRPVRR